MAKAKKSGKTMGRPPVDDQFKKFRTTVSLETYADEAWSNLAKKAGCSKGQLAAWLSLSPEAAKARELAVKGARFFRPPVAD
jgi:hypothetical protein